MRYVGRLTRVPYWTCLGAQPGQGEVEAEVRDWYDTLAARPKDLIAWFQTQLRVRGVYDGPADGVVNAPTKEAVARYREALGLSREPKLTLDFLRAYLAADHRQIAARAATGAAAAPALAQAARPAATPTPAPAPAAARPAAPVAAAAPASVTTAAAAPTAALPGAAPGAAAPLLLRVGTANAARRFRGGERIELELRPSRDAYVACFHQDENRQVRRFFPNRFHADARVSAATGLQLPGPMRFELRMNERGAPEAVACFASERELLPTLSSAIAGADFKPLPVTLEQVRAAFAQAGAAGGALAHEQLALQPR
jgi:hypothetical protein